MDAKLLINKLTGQTVVTISRAWWTNAAFDMPGGRIGVARIDAESTTLRYSGIVGDYTTSADYTGRPVTYMIDLTEDDLIEYGIKPGILDWPRVIDGRRPASNKISAPVSIAAQQRYIDWLQNEGY